MFLRHRVQDRVPLDCFIVPTVAHKVLFVLLILAITAGRSCTST
jgi:hypothetical protein